VNLPNYITLSRIASIPLLIWMLTTRHLSSAHGQRELLTSLLFTAASLTDTFDGYLARRRAR